MIKEENGNGARLKLTAGSRSGFNIYGNTNKHDKLKNLEYEKSGHTGFQKELTFDEIPTKDSKNPVTSGGVYKDMSDKGNAKYLGGVDFNQIFAPGIYTVNIKECTKGSVPDLPDGLYGEAVFVMSAPYNDGEYDNYNQILIMSGYSNAEEYFKQYARYIGRNNAGTDIEEGEWVKLSDSLGMGGGSGNVNLSNYYNKDETNALLSEKPSMSEVEAYIEETLLGGAW